MCLAKVFLQQADGEPVAESVTSLTQTAEGVVVTTLFNETLTFPGQVRSIDFTGSTITIA